MPLIFILIYLFLNLNSAQADIGPSSTGLKLEQSPPANRIQTNILYLLNKNWNLELDFPISEQFTLGPTFMHMANSRSGEMSVGTYFSDSYTSTMTANSLGIRGNWYLGHSYKESGLLLSPYFRFVPGHIEGQRNGVHASGDFSGKEIGALFTRQYAWPSGLSFSLGVGFGYIFDCPQIIKTSGIELPVAGGLFGSGATLTLDASIGWLL